MRPKPAPCVTCPLNSRGLGFVEGYGTGDNGVLILGEAPGQREAQTSRPFVGLAGAQLNRTLELVGHPRDAFRIENVCRCQPPNNWLENAPWESEATVSCSYYTSIVLEEYKPRVIVPMGNVALKYTVGVTGIDNYRGYVYKRTVDDHECFVVPTYHPAFIMRGQQKLTDVHVADVRKALQVAEHGYTEPVGHYIQHPSSADIARFIIEAEEAAAMGGWLAADIETPTSGGVAEDEYGDILDAEIVRISFAFKPHHAITLSWNNVHYEAIQRLFNIPFAYVVFWNQGFDVPRLKAKNIRFRSPILDAMMMWHFHQSDLPKRLGYVATFFTQVEEWKSLSEVLPEYYSCKDSDVTIQCAYALRNLLIRQERFNSFIKHYVELQPKVDIIASSGVIIDRQQQQKFRGEIDKELERINGELQQAIPRDVRPFEPRRQIPSDANIGTPYKTATKRGVWDIDLHTGEWGVRLDFLYGSPKQVVAYMRYRGHPVPRNHKTGKDTTAAAEIEELAEKYPDDELYPRILSARGFRKIKGQYIEGYNPDPDGRVRTHFDRKPSTWRFNSENPNVQNVLKRSELAAEYRRQFVAGEKKVLAEIDYKALEAQLVGYYANDPQYIRAAKLGVHAILMTHVTGNPVDLSRPEAEIRPLLKGLKHEDPVLYDACKHVVHLSNYGGSAKRIRIEFPEHFPSVRDAKEKQDTYFATIAKKVRRWQQATLSQAFDLHYLENVYGYRHYFWDALHYVARQGGALEWGTDAKRALAFLPQSTGAGLLCEALLMIWKRREVFSTLRWIIHDSVIAEIPEDKFEEYVGFIRECMETPQPLLGGLSVEVEIEYGKNWGELKEYHG